MTRNRQLQTWHIVLACTAAVWSSTTSTSQAVAISRIVGTGDADASNGQYTVFPGTPSIGEGTGGTFNLAFEHAGGTNSGQAPTGVVSMMGYGLSSPLLTPPPTILTPPVGVAYHHPSAGSFHAPPSYQEYTGGIASHVGFSGHRVAGDVGRPASMWFPSRATAYYATTSTISLGTHFDSISSIDEFGKVNSIITQNMLVEPGRLLSGLPVAIGLTESGAIDAELGNLSFFATDGSETALFHYFGNLGIVYKMAGAGDLEPSTGLSFSSQFQSPGTLRPPSVIDAGTAAFTTPNGAYEASPSYSPRVIADKGDSAPTRFPAAMSFVQFGDLAATGGVIAFEAAVAPPGPPKAPHGGIYSRVGGTLDAIVEIGDWLPLGGGHAQIVGLDMGHEALTTVAGSPMLTFKATFSNSREAIYVAEISRPRIHSDLTFDGAVDAADASLLFANWGMVGEPAQGGPGDLNGDAVIDAADAGLLFSQWSGDGIHSTATILHAASNGATGCDASTQCASVPEPTSGLGVAAFIAVFLLRRVPFGRTH